MSDVRIEREKDYHDKLFSHDSEDRSGAGKYYAIMEGAETDFRNLIVSSCHGKRLLEYGCGTGGDSMYWLQMGAILTGIDISKEGVRLAQERIAQTDFTAVFFAMNAEDTDFEDNSFDIVIGTAIIHHLDIRKSYAELARILDVDGRAIFLEPLGHNPFINLYRRLTPSMRTVDEHPLRQADIALAQEYFKDVSEKYYHLFALLAVPFRNAPFFEDLLRFLVRLDTMVMKSFPFLTKYAWYMILDMKFPKL